MDARILLAEMRIRGEVPKLGALCRWVRDLDVVSGLSAQVNGISHTDNNDRSENDKELLLVLDAILRVTGPIDVACKLTPESDDAIDLQDVWNLRARLRPSQKVYESVLDKTIFESYPVGTKEQFKIIENTPGPLRKPPNHHPAILYASNDNAIPLSEDALETSIEHHPVVPDLALIMNVLSPEECKNIVAAGEAIGFLPDAPVKDGDSEDHSVLAHNFYWLVDEAFSKKLWDRVQPYVPKHVEGRKARCLNRRFRVYRYVPGAEYRCHIGMC